MKAGKLIVLSAPSGGGKSSVIQALRKMDENLDYSISVTTRPRRPLERHGIDYLFVSDEEFDAHIRANQFLEWARVHHDRYATLRQPIEEGIREGKTILLDIDVQGGLAVKKAMPESVLIFIYPPSIQVLEDRLRKRGTEAENRIKIRLQNAETEMTFGKKYDFHVINQDLEETVLDVFTIIERVSPSKY